MRYLLLREPSTAGTRNTYVWSRQSTLTESRCFEVKCYNFAKRQVQELRKLIRSFLEAFFIN